MLDYAQDALYSVATLALPFCLMGSLLPTWMLINTLQLIAHTPLVNTQMPANAHYFIVKYLNIVRLDFDSVNESIESGYEMHRFESGEHFFNRLLFMCGYKPLYAQNLIIVVGTVLVLAVIWNVIALKDYLSRPSQLGYLCRSRSLSFVKNSHEPVVTNFALRFFYEMFLEICICVMINITFLDFESFSSGF